MRKMTHPYVLAWISVFVTTLLALCGVVLKRRKVNRISSARTESVTSVSAVDGECRSADGCDTDVIIVGAGVAGSALAHTLGKVLFSFFFFLFRFLGIQSRTSKSLVRFTISFGFL